MQLSLVSSDGDLREVACRGDMSVLDVQRKVDPLEQLLKPGCFTYKVLLSLEKATFMDTAVVGWLIQCHKHFQEAGGRLILHSIPPLIDEVFQFLKLSAVLHVTGDETTARRLAQEVSHGPQRLAR